jgi:hypothetical protein
MFKSATFPNGRGIGVFLQGRPEDPSIVYSRSSRPLLDLLNVFLPCFLNLSFTFSQRSFPKLFTTVRRNPGAPFLRLPNNASLRGAGPTLSNHLLNPAMLIPMF